VVPDVKVCGLVRSADAAAAAEAGVRYLGVIFADSRRRVAPDEARRVLDGALGRDVRRVGVFGAASTLEILAAADAARLDVLQLHVPPDATGLQHLRSQFDGAIWGVVRVSPAGLTSQEWQAWRLADAVVVDTWSATALGGTGVPFAWSDAAAAIVALRGVRPLVLAGGLTALNVAAAIGALSPEIVDVSSGVERVPGEKDPHRIAAFMKAVRGEIA
jgi:phosphoribosylanthranilate isomerase